MKIVNILVFLLLSAVAFADPRLDQVSKVYKTDSATALQLLREILKETDDPGDILYRMGFVYETHQDPRALKYYFDAMKQSTDKQLPDIINRIGILFFNVNGYDDALRYFSKLIPLYEGSPEKVSRTYRNIGLCQAQLFRFEEAKDAFTKAEQLSSSNSDRFKALREIGNMYFQWGKYDSARVFGIKALEFAKNGEDSATIHNNIGNAMIQMAQYPAASNHLRVALQLKQGLNDDYLLANTLKNLGLNYLYAGDSTSAVDYLVASVQMGKSTHIFGDQIQGYDLLTQLYAAKNDYREALKYSDSSNHLLKQENSTHENLSAIADYYHIRNYEQIIEMREREKRRDRENVFIIAGSVILGLLIWFVSKSQFGKTGEGGVA